MAQFETSHFGTIDYNPESVITFPKGIIQLEGFEHCTRYVLFHEEASSGVFHYLSLSTTQTCHSPWLTPLSLGSTMRSSSATKRAR